MGVVDRVKSFIAATDLDNESDYDYEDYNSYEIDEEDFAPVNQEKQSAVRFSRTDNDKIINYTSNNKKDYEINYFTPKNSSEAPAITKSFRDGKLCIINISELTDSDAQTMADFIAGAAFALNGTVKGISEEIFLAIPSTISYRGDFYAEVAKYSGSSLF